MAKLTPDRNFPPHGRPAQSALRPAIPHSTLLGTVVIRTATGTGQKMTIHRERVRMKPLGEDHSN